MTFKYLVVTRVSSLENPEKTADGLEILVKTDNYQTARRECIEWAEFDDILVSVITQQGVEKFTCDGYQEAWDRFPKVCEAA